MIGAADVEGLGLGVLLAGLAVLKLLTVTGGRAFIPFTEIAFSEKSIVDACHPKVHAAATLNI